MNSQINGMPRFYLVLALLAALTGNCAGFKTAAFESGRGTDPALEAPSVHRGIAPGFRGPIRVAVRTQGGIILEIEILDHEDDPPVGGAAMEALREQILDENTTDLDAISGATESSAGFLQAVKNALGVP
jgi:uncharacterized protein with FMN-binding domain